MTLGAALARRDRVLVGAGFLVGGAAIPWLPGPWLPTAPPLMVMALAFLLPMTALTTCIGQAVFAARGRAHAEGDRASARAVAAATTTLCSFALSLQLLVLTTLVNAPFQPPSPARAAVVLFGIHLVAVGNVLPRLRPGWPSGVAARDGRHHAWMRISRAAGHLCVVIGIAVAIAGGSLGGPQIDAVLKGALVGVALWAAWSVRQLRTA